MGDDGELLEAVLVSQLPDQLSEVERDEREVGARGWIVKPFAPKKLILAVCQVLNLPPPNDRILLDKISTGEEIADD